MIKTLANEIKELKQQQNQTQTNKSDSVKDLFAALAKAQSEIKSAMPTCENPYFKSKYADLNEMIKASRPALTNNNLAVVQLITSNNKGQQVLQSILGHASGEWICSEMIITPPKTDIQSLGSYITYLRRYSYAALVGVAVADEDDDGNAAVAAQNKQPNKESLTQDQINYLKEELEDYPDIQKTILDSFKITDITQLPSDKFYAVARRIKEIQQLTK